MLFCSAQYVCFFAVVFAAYWAMPWRRARVWLLLAASVYFYARWNRQLAALICLSCTVDYLVARALDASARPRLRKLLLGCSLAANLGLLCYFKYANFFLQSLAEAARAAGADVSLPLLEVILPVGISFYTFEAINYMVDVYRKKVPAERDFAHFLLFILFFPHLVAGPIVRARDFLPQIRRRKRFSWPRAQLGVRLLLMGLFKKLAVADRMALLADPVFQDPGAYTSGAARLAMLAYAVQIYCDFSGYTDMAIGCAHLLGYKLARNFDMPYLSANVSEFWRRWHISLSSWLRDYLFIPLGGSRGGRWKTCRNLFLTMALGGLWHGASWTFVLWGCLHGLLLVLHRALQSVVARLPRLDRLLGSAPGTGLRVATTFACVCACWVLFRATTLAGAGRMLGRALGQMGGLPAPLPPDGLWYVLAVVAACHLIGRRGLWERLSPRLPGPALGLGYAVAASLILLLTTDTDKAFIYFQF
jgi:alginate O-acetyltransferase complex protein AlgI